MKCDAQLFGQVIVHPNIVVACKEMDRNAIVNNIGNSTQKTGEATRGNFLVVDPKVENIAYQINFRGILPNGVQPIYKMLFAPQAYLVVR